VRQEHRRIRFGRALRNTSRLCDWQSRAVVGVSSTPFGTGQVSDEAIARAIRETFDLRPKAIIDALNLLAPRFIVKTAAYGHFGREDADFTWEKTDKVEQLKKAVV
jgi:S-adenosylmethionine synthetase